MSNQVVTGTYPFPLGKLFPAGSFATVSVPLTTNIQPIKKDSQTGATLNDNFWNGVLVQAPAANTGKVYICSNASQPDIATCTNLIAELAPGGVYSQGKEWATKVDIGALFVGTTNATDYAWASLFGF
jgi:hypothetical protein